MKKLKHAIIETGGKQYRVSEGDLIYIEKLGADAGSSVTFDRVLAVIDDADTVFGVPFVEGAVVTGNVVKNGRGKKIRVYKMKPKKNYQRTQGHRQPYTKVQIETIA
ncbi:MAG: 50S ribosomal protein L21 [Clostridia bacterium]|nr:50S ribosomal protein L21 [Clostridia bacterium]